MESRKTIVKNDGTGIEEALRQTELVAEAYQLPHKNALHLRLLGDTWYFGRVHHKAEIGDGGRRVEPEDITRAVRLMERTAVEMFVTGLALLVFTATLR